MYREDSVKRPSKGWHANYVTLFLGRLGLNPVWQVGCEGSRGDPERSEGERREAEDRSPPRQAGFRQIWRRRSETNPVA